MMGLRSLITLSMALLVAFGWTQQKPKQLAKTQTAKTAEQDSETLQFSFSTFEHSDVTDEGEATKFTATDKDTVVSGQKAKWNQKKKVAEVTGDLKMTDPKADGTGEKALIYYASNKKLVVITGNVLITVKPKEKSARPGEPAAAPGAQAKPLVPAPVKVNGNKATVEPAPDDNDESARNYPAIITCDKAEYYYAKDKKHGILTGNFKVVQKLPKKTRTLTAEHGEWFGKDEKIILYPPVHLEDTEGTDFDPVGEVTLHTKEGEEKVSMPHGGTGKIVVKDEEEEKDTSGGKKKPQ